MSNKDIDLEKIFFNICGIAFILGFVGMLIGIFSGNEDIISTSAIVSGVGLILSFAHSITEKN